MDVCDMVWFGWAGSRSILEGATKFFDQMRRDEDAETGKKYVVKDYALESDRAFFEKLMELGVLSRCGKIEGIYQDQKCILYYTRAVNNGG